MSAAIFGILSRVGKIADGYRLKTQLLGFTHDVGKLGQCYCRERPGTRPACSRQMTLPHLPPMLPNEWPTALVVARAPSAPIGMLPRLLCVRCKIAASQIGSGEQTMIKRLPTATFEALLRPVLVAARPRQQSAAICKLMNFPNFFFLIVTIFFFYLWDLLNFLC